MTKNELAGYRFTVDLDHYELQRSDAGPGYWVVDQSTAQRVGWIESSDNGRYEAEIDSGYKTFPTLEGALRAALGF